MDWIIHHGKKLIIAIVGTLLVLLGVAMVPYPGPGWLVVFAGLAVLATEFEFASKVLDNLRSKYDQWQKWVKQQKYIVRIGILSITGLVIVLTAWLLNSFGMINSILNLRMDWLYSPLM